MTKKQESIPENLRRRILERDEYRCRFRVRGRICGRPATHVDHIVPRRYGGATEEHNLRAACEECNTRAGAEISNTIQAAKRNDLREW